MRNRGSGSNELEVPDIGQSEFGTVSISHVYIFVYSSCFASLFRILLDEFGTQLNCILIFFNKYQLYNLYEIENTAWQRGTQVNGCMFVPSYPLRFCNF